MTLPKTASISSYDGAKNDYSAGVDSSTDRAAAGANPAYNDVAEMTQTAFRVWAHLTLYASGAAPTVVANNECWNATGLNAAPAFARTGPGQYTATYPSTVVDEIPLGAPGYVGPQAVNLLGGIGNVRSSLPTPTSWGDLKVTPLSANVLGLSFWHQAPNGIMTLGDPVFSSIDVDFFSR
jgi:hypothetical protein